MRRTLVVLFVLGACDVGEVKTGGPEGGSPGAATFQSMISPLVTRCRACHGTTPAPNLSSFSALQDKYKTKPGTGNILVTKGTLGTPPGTHQAIMYLSAADQATVASWIDSL